MGRGLLRPPCGVRPRSRAVLPQQVRLLRRLRRHRADRGPAAPGLQRLPEELQERLLHHGGPVPFPGRRDDQQAVVLRGQRLRHPERRRLRHQHDGLPAGRVEQPRQHEQPVLEDLRSSRGREQDAEVQDARGVAGNVPEGRHQLFSNLPAGLPRRGNHVGRGPVLAGGCRRGIHAWCQPDHSGRRADGPDRPLHQDGGGALDDRRHREVRAGHDP
mmetsp:Transcript_86799/g.229980  ORF Transcript_86799/g.229980 Transcript_86799/m.229980 type:complete len:216 (+) Transcript_86799:254-901(+)